MSCSRLRATRLAAQQVVAADSACTSLGHPACNAFSGIVAETVLSAIIFGVGVSEQAGRARSAQGAAAERRR
jgi:hypothetical protein